MNAPVSRRTLLQAGSAALGAAMVPGGIGGAPFAAGLSAAAVPPGFDPAAFIADLKAIGCRPYAFRVVRPGGVLGPWRYCIAAPEGRGFGWHFREVMERWSDALKACPNHGERVAAYIADIGGANA